MVTTLRSSIGREAEAKRAPHSEQNFASGAFFEPQAEHVTIGEAYVPMARVPNALRRWRSPRGAGLSPDASVLAEREAVGLGPGSVEDDLEGAVDDRPALANQLIEPLLGQRAAT